MDKDLQAKIEISIKEYEGAFISDALDVAAQRADHASRVANRLSDHPSTRGDQARYLAQVTGIEADLINALAAIQQAKARIIEGKQY